MSNRFGIAARSIESERLDLALTRPPFSLSRREAKRVIGQHRIAVEGHILSVESRRILSGSRIALLEPSPSLPILDEQNDLLVVDKPAALPTQPSPDDPNPSVIELLASMLKQRGDEARETYVVHRLDTNTTGVLLVAKTKEAAARYSRLVADEALKNYLAIAEGRVKGEMAVDAPIGRIEGNLFGVTPLGKRARSTLRTLASTDLASMVDVELHSGRTHQIRIHLAHLGHPVVGDQKYGHGSAVGNASRPMLHAATLRIGPRLWEAPVPADFADCAARLSLTFPPRAPIA